MLKKIITAIVVLIIVLFAAFNIYISYNFTSNITNLIPREETQKTKYKFLEKHHYDYAAFKKKFPIDSLSIKSSHESHDIPIDHIKSDNSNDNVILVHGLGGTKETVMPVAEMFLKLGFNVYAYDQRNSGENKAPSNTFGMKEAQDLRDVVDYVDKNNKGKIIVWGESFGGATAAIASKDIEDKIGAMILDSPMSNGALTIKDVVSPISKEMGMPLSYLMALGNIGFKIKEGYQFKDLDGTSYIKQTKIPLLVIHSKNDEIIRYQEGKDLYEASQAKHKKLYTIDNGKHTEYIFEEPQKYQSVVQSFLQPLK